MSDGVKLQGCLREQEQPQGGRADGCLRREAVER